MRTIVFSIGLLGASLASSGLQAAVIEISFSGNVTAVNNVVGEYWDPATVVGSTVNGRLWLDDQLATRGHANDGGIWYWDIENRPGAMTSALDIGGQSFAITADNEAFVAEFEGPPAVYYNTQEWIDLQNSKILEDELIPDALYLSDHDTVTAVLGNSTATLQQQSISIYIWDYLTDFIPKQIDMEFDWSAFVLPAYPQNGSGDFRYLQNVLVQEPAPGDLPQYETLFDTLIQFQLTDIALKYADESVPVTEPDSILLMLLGLLVFATRLRT